MGQSIAPGMEQAGRCSLAHNWWLFALRGAMAIGFGFLAMMVPVATLMIMATVFGLYALVDGILALVAGIRRSSHGQRWGGIVTSGLLGIVVGVMILAKVPTATVALSAFLWSMFAFWALIVGILDLVAAVRLRQAMEGEWRLALRGLLSIMLGLTTGLLTWRNPLASLVGLGFLVGLGSLLSGTTLLLLAFRLRGERYESLGT